VTVHVIGTADTEATVVCNDSNAGSVDSDSVNNDVTVHVTDTADTEATVACNDEREKRQIRQIYSAN